MIIKLDRHAVNSAQSGIQTVLNRFTNEQIATDLQIFGPVGCPQCTDGYKGRVGIYEVMPVTEEIGRIIMAGGSAMDIKEQAAAEGVWNLRQSALKKVADGVTSLDEVNRVTVE